MTQKVKHPVGELSEKLLMYFMKHALNGYKDVMSAQDDFIGIVAEYEDKFFDAIDEAHNAGRTECGGEPKQGYGDSKYLPIYERRV
jgi:hypothetical protein